MLKLKLALLLLSSLFFLTTPTRAAELSCPDGGGALEIQYGDIVNCSLESAGDLDVFAIAASEGDFISANVNYTGNDECETLQLVLRGLDENNVQLAIATSGVCSGTRIEFKAAKTRAYTITIADRFEDDIGEYQVEFQCISGPCISQALLPKQECSATFDGSEFKVPYIEFSQKIFFADFKLIPGSSPLTFELTTADEKQ